MGKAGKIVYHFLMYLLSPFLLLFSSSLLIFFILNRFLTPTVTDYSVFPYVSALFALFFALPLFLLLSIAKIPFSKYKNNPRPNSGIEWIRRIPIEMRLRVRPYFLVLSVSLLLILLAVNVKNYISLTTPTTFPPFDMAVFFVTYFGAFISFLAYLTIYRQEEKSVYLLRRFLKSCDLCFQGISVNTKDFEDGLKAYQKTLPSAYWLVSLGEKVKQLKLILDRGTKEDKIETLKFIQSLVPHILLKETYQFDAVFSKLSYFLAEKTSEKADIIKISSLPTQPEWRVSSRRIFRSGLEKMVPYGVLFLFIAAFYALFHITLPWI